MKISKIQALIAFGALIGSAAAFASNTAADASKAESLAHAERCISIHSSEVIKGTTSRCDKVKKAFLDETTLAKFEVAYASHKKVKAEAKAQAAKQKAADEKAYKELLAAQAKAKQEAEAKFKAEGWWQAQPGIYVRWCTQTCNNSKVIGDNRYSLMEVWAKDRNAGDIYARVNLMSKGVVIGWTNDTTYLSKGQRGVLTFDSYQYFDSAQLTEFNARG